MTRRREHDGGRAVVVAMVLLLAVVATAVPAVSRLRTAATFTASTTVTGNAVAPRTCTSATAWNAGVSGLSGLADWLRLGEASGTSAVDTVGGTWTYSGTFTYSVPGALFCQAPATGNAVDPVSTTARITAPPAGAYSSTLGSYATGVTYAVWFKGSTTTEAGRLLGLGNTSTAGSGTTATDRVLWVDSAGSVRFGTTGGTLLSSTAGFLNGQWHLAVVTMTSAAAILYVDGAAVASSASPSYYSFGAVNIFWRVGYDASTGTGRKPATSPTAPFTGLVDEVVVARSNLSAATVSSLWNAGSTP